MPHKVTNTKNAEGDSLGAGELKTPAHPAMQSIKLSFIRREFVDMARVSIYEIGVK